VKGISQYAIIGIFVVVLVLAYFTGILGSLISVYPPGTTVDVSQCQRYEYSANDVGIKTACEFTTRKEIDRIYAIEITNWGNKGRDSYGTGCSACYPGRQPSPFTYDFYIDGQKLDYAIEEDDFNLRKAIFPKNDLSLTGLTHEFQVRTQYADAGPYWFDFGEIKVVYWSKCPVGVRDYDKSSPTYGECILPETPETPEPEEPEPEEPEESVEPIPSEPSLLDQFINFIQSLFWWWPFK